ncbi:ABC transporter permease [Mycolicibacterium hippocampi]|uniref:ABC transporter permease n=1 Tax=Mycolicibacterium hippocampi TaxID=659824 RepID=A0A7I9ZPG5_9MYCO|nr:ABC transporter permease subunit [Mycolicibacterium hippocampi]GFH02951.1 ABC transporter permease [Mycolicibacterium hippocampi]
MTSADRPLQPAPRALLMLSAAAVLLMAWQLFWEATDFLPSPTQTVQTAGLLLGEAATYEDLWATLRRLILGLAMGYTAAVVVALLMQISSWWNRFFGPAVYVTITAPSMVVALLSLMVFGLAEFGVCMSVAIVVFPFVVVSLNEGVKALDPRLTEMSQIYGFGPLDRIRHLALPEMAPYLFSAFRNVHALGWKIVVIAELFSQQIGVGAEYKRAYGYFELDRLIVWTLFFIVMITTVEYLILRPIERRVFRWRAPTRRSLRAQPTATST